MKSVLILLHVASVQEGLGDTDPSFLFLLGDDIGWADFGYNGGTALTPNIDRWTKRDGTVVMQDGHSGGTICAPTRATILTGRNHFRDCVSTVYDCSDMTECEPRFPFAQQRTFTFPDAARASKRGYESWFGGKWHLGSLYNDSEVPSSPLLHGFDRMNATVEVAPTATANCGCRADWAKSCNLGHYHKHNHCAGGPGPGGPSVPNGCCFNYWSEDPTSEHGVTNLTNPSYDDDSSYLAEAFIGFLESREGRPFAAQVSFHNCHIPFIGTSAARQACKEGKTCRQTNRHGDSPDTFTDAELDFYACLNELDAAVGSIFDALDKHGYYKNTFIWFTTDNGPEVNCQPLGFCTNKSYQHAPGDAGPLRGRKRDIWEGGHRVPTIVSWPAVQTGAARVSWDTVVTMDFLPTVMEALSMDRPAEQRAWGLDGKSIMPILEGKAWPHRGIGWAFNKWSPDIYGFRYGKWKYVHDSTSCGDPSCHKDMLFDLEADLSERNDLSATFPDVMTAIMENFTKWKQSVDHSRQFESLCTESEPQVEANPQIVKSREECCERCSRSPSCVAADFHEVRSRVPKPSGVYLETLEDDLNPVVGFQCKLLDSLADAESYNDACSEKRVIVT